MKKEDHVSRIEGLSDSVFAFAATLLVVSLEVPHEFHEFLDRMAGDAVFVFVICFSLLMLVWYTQNQYFRDYGIEDGKSLFWNAVLLMTVLFSVYPLKLVVANILAPPAKAVPPSEFPHLMALFSGGVFMISLVFSALFFHVLAHKRDSNLTAGDTLLAIYRARTHLGHAIAALVSVLCSYIFGAHTSTSWQVYMALPPCWIGLYWSYRRSMRSLGSKP